MSYTKKVADKKELAEMIMVAAIEKVLKLGFRMKVGHAGQSMLPEILPGGLNILYYSTDNGNGSGGNHKPPKNTNPTSNHSPAHVEICTKRSLL